MAVPTLARTLAAGAREWMDLCRRAEELGFHSVWTGDTAAADAFVDAAYAVAVTDSITVGIAAALPTRSPLQTAFAAAALAQPRRLIVLGLAAGNPATNTFAHGAGYRPVVARVRDFTTCVTAVLRTPAGEPVEVATEHFRVSGRGLGVGADRVQVALGAHGPEMTALAGEASDGLIVHLLTPRSEISGRLDAAQRRHPAEGFLRAAGVVISVHDDETAAMSQARTAMSGVLRLPRFRPRLDGVAPGADPDQLDEEVIRQFVLVSTPARLLDDIAEFAEAEVLIPVPVSLFMPSGPQSDAARAAVLAGLLRRSRARTRS